MIMYHNIPLQILRLIKEEQLHFKNEMLKYKKPNESPYYLQMKKNYIGDTELERLDSIIETLERENK